METLCTKRLTLYFVLFLFCSVNLFTDLRCNGQLLPDEEVQALQTISAKLKLTNINFNRSFCSSGGVRNSTIGNDIVTDFICNPCNETFCHVTNILLKGQNLTGTLPEEFGNLSYLQQIDLTRNYLSGPIPTSFARIPLTILSLLGNRINGSIPKEIGDIATLEELILEDNDLEGTLPENLGNLSRLKRLLLSANNMTGTIPAQFGNLKNIRDFRIDGNRISGKIPDFIGNWTNMTRLDIQGTSMGGPFPSNISVMKNMKELRILNLNASAIEFPDLSGMTQLTLLILRNCGLTGPIPPYIGGFTALRTLDLSHNMLTGQIPAAFQSLTLNYMFLNNNHLSGTVPSWVLNSNQNYFDISYNNFSDLSSVGCQASIVNLVASNAPTQSNSVSWCLKQDLSCSSKPQHYSLFINCGGDKLSYDGNEYEEDKGNEGPAFFGPSAEKWAYSSNGVYLNQAKAPYKATNTFGLNVTGGDIYNTARLAPNSLIYYGLCMRQGSYKVVLHFAEIMYSADQTFSSLGKRIFDVAIQGNVVLTDFNIAEKAKGVGKGTTEEFPDIYVNGSTLEIHLYWSGKGTTAIPDRGVYGPLISAISVTPNFDVSDSALSAGAIAGIVVGSCVGLLALILLVLWQCGYIFNKDTRDKELAALELQTGYYSLRQIKQATSNFDPVNKIGEGGFGPVYKGTLSDGAVIAVKQLSAKSKQGNREFVTEIGMISALQHPNLVKLYGCCIEGNQLLLIYEYLENNSLARALFGKEEQLLNLDWPTRKRICLGIAKGLTYLHEGILKIVHRDIKATNVLLDKDLNAKISDFGLAKLDEEENTHISTRIAGTIGYMAPEYAMRGYLTDKADVYSFGIVALEIVSGKSNTNYMPKEEFVYLLDWAYVLQEQGSLLELVDPVLGTNYSRKEALSMLNIGLLCTNPSPTLRPTMSAVVSMLEGKSPIQAPLVKRSLPNEELRFKAFELLSHDSQTNVSSASQESHVKRNMSMDGPWIDSSISSQSDFINHSPTSRLIPRSSSSKFE